MIRALALILMLTPGLARAVECGTALALALDISSSVNAREYAIQKDGLAAALLHPEVRQAALMEPGSVWIAVYEWSGWQQQDLVADWTQINGEADLDRLANQIFNHQRRYAEFSTAIGEALEYGAALFGALPVPCRRHVIDVSGDGVNNDGMPADTLHGAGVLNRITVNGLVIKGAHPDPEAHYREEVIWGPSAFLMVARNGFDDYPEMIVGKLVRELDPPLFIGAVDTGGATR